MRRWTADDSSIQERPFDSGSAAMPSRSKILRALTLVAPLWLLGPFVGCSSLCPPPSPREVSLEGSRARLLVPVALERVEEPAEAARPDRPSPLPPLTHSPSLTRDTAPPGTSEKPGPPPVFSLPQAVAFGLQNSPRLQAALAAIERARGQEQVAFAP